MTSLFYKLLAYKSLKEQADYILNSRDPEIYDFIFSNNGYNPIEKLKELEDDLDSQLLTPEIYDFIFSNIEEQDTFGDIKELYDLIDERFKTYDRYIIEHIKVYLLTKKLTEL